MGYVGVINKSVFMNEEVEGPWLEFTLFSGFLAN
jgi:hypothetical protein